LSTAKPETQEAKVHTKNPWLSVVIPTYNTKGVLEECLRGLSEQECGTDSCEVLVVNDGGREEDPGSFHALVQGVPLRYVRQSHRGPAAARNLGIQLAKGEIVVFLDDDSVPLKGWLQATISAWMETPECDGIGGYVASDPSDSIYCRVSADFFNWYLEQQGPGGQCIFLVTCNAGYRKSTLEKIGGFDDRFVRACGEDRDLNLRIVRCGGRLRLDRRILVYHDRDLTLKSFIKKNYHYGMAASRIYSSYPEQKRISAGGYGDLFRSIWKRYAKWGERAMALCLITVSQAATATGFLVGALRAHGSRNGWPERA
jgi:cellulose synthase/poly-beta-1,6-N-acetylglucosamine synthase-like glycosyltransferase